MGVLFSGFSTVGGTRDKSFKLYDIDLVKQDLLNHFFTRVGERVMLPDYGCRIWDYLMEPFTAYVKLAVINEATRICESDARVEIVGIDARTNENSILIDIVLRYKIIDVVREFTVAFENRQAQLGY